MVNISMTAIYCWPVIKSIVCTCLSIHSLSSMSMHSLNLSGSEDNNSQVNLQSDLSGVPVTFKEAQCQAHGGYCHQNSGLAHMASTKSCLSQPIRHSPTIGNDCSCASGSQTTGMILIKHWSQAPVIQVQALTSKVRPWTSEERFVASPRARS